MHINKLIYTLFLSLCLFSVTLTKIPSIEAYEPQENQPISQLNFQDDAILALNYHRVRERTLGTSLINNLSNSQELEVYSVYEDEFDHQMNWLINQGANFLTVDEVIQALEEEQVPEKAVWVSFDDMDQSVFDQAHPILEKYGIPATGFVISGQVGNQNFNNLQMMNLNDLQALDQSGLWSFGLHTHDLHYLSLENESLLVQANHSKIIKDLALNQQYLLEHLENIKPNMIAYPYGQANDQTIKALHHNEIEFGFTLEERPIVSPENKFYIPRVLVSRSSFERLIKTWPAFVE